ncbi:MAG TPA: response regulator [Acidimicrobiales bacterium]|nr:response regulator [Acidimicrobiales bacterium]
MSETRDVLIATDSPNVRDEVRAVLGARDYTVRTVNTGELVIESVRERTPDLLVCDFQIGNMGGMAITLELRNDESGGRLDHVPVLLLVDRRPDVFLARRSEADGFLVKPLDPIRLRRAITAILDGGTYEDDSYRPAESPAARPDVTAAR